jgi:hypothetical protein
LTGGLASGIKKRDAFAGIVRLFFIVLLVRAAPPAFIPSLVLAAVIDESSVLPDHFFHHGESCERLKSPIVLFSER